MVASPSRWSNVYGNELTDVIAEAATSLMIYFRVSKLLAKGLHQISGTVSRARKSIIFNIV